MISLGSGETDLLEVVFPRLSTGTSRDRLYVIGDTKELVMLLEMGQLPKNELENFEFAVDMSIACLWPYVAGFFQSESFGSRFGAAVEVLKAGVYAAEEDSRAGLLARTLADSLTKWEVVLQKSADPTIAKAAEGGD